MLVVIEDVHWADRSTRDLLSLPVRPPLLRPGRRARVLPLRRPAPPPPAARGRGPVGAGCPGSSGCSSTRCPTPTYARLVQALLPGAAVRGRRCTAIVRARRGQRVLRRGAGRARPRAPGARRAARGPRRPAAGPARPARRRRPRGGPRGRRAPVAGSRTPCSPPSSACDDDELDARAAHRRRAERPGRRSAPTATPSGTRCSPRRSTTTCCPASGSGCTPPTPRRCAAGASTAPPPSWPGTPGLAHDPATAVAGQHRGRRRGDGGRRARRGRRALRGRAGAGWPTRGWAADARPGRPRGRRRRRRSSPRATPSGPSSWSAPSSRTPLGRSRRTRPGPAADVAGDGVDDARQRRGPARAHRRGARRSCPTSPAPLRARLLSLHARAQLWHGHDEDAAQQAMEALGLAQKLDLPSVVADVTTTLAGIDDRAGDAETAQRALRPGHRAGPPATGTCTPSCAAATSWPACTTSAVTSPRRGPPTTRATLLARGQRPPLGALRLRGPADGGAGRLRDAATGTTSLAAHRRRRPVAAAARGGAAARRPGVRGLRRPGRPGEPPACSTGCDRCGRSTAWSASARGRRRSTCTAAPATSRRDAARRSTGAIERRRRSPGPRRSRPGSG